MNLPLVAGHQMKQFWGPPFCTSPHMAWQKTSLGLSLHQISNDPIGKQPPFRILVPPIQQHTYHRYETYTMHYVYSKILISINTVINIWTKLTFTVTQRENGIVTRTRIKENIVSSIAHIPGPSGSAAKV